MSEKKLGKYTLIRHLATGGMAEIWLAEQRGPGGFNKELVIKKILPHLAEEGDMTQMFFDEARVVAQLTHPNIGQVFELGEHDGDYFIAMEFIDGYDLQELREEIEKKGRQIPVNYAARIVCDVLKALDYAHNYSDRDGTPVGLIHRDVSPHNVLISVDGVVKLVDFGVAKGSMNTHKTETGAVKGKFAYMAPEQIEQQDLDRRVDIFAVGVLFFELVTGVKPFGEDLAAVSKIISQDAPHPHQFRQDIPPQLVSIMLCALARDRLQRFATAADMERAIEDYLKVSAGMVGQRELSVMVRQLRGDGVGTPTNQLFGFESQGVQKEGPRVTQSGSQNLPPLYATAQVQVSQHTAPGQMTGQMTGQRTSPSQQMTEMAVPAPPPHSASAGTWLAFAAAMVVMLGVFSTASLVVLAGSNSLSDTVQLTAGPAWSHGEDSRIVHIDADEPADVVYDGQVVGQTPFHTFLRPGNYDVELSVGDNATTVEVVIEEEPQIQSFRFEL